MEKDYKAWHELARNHRIQPTYLGHSGEETTAPLDVLKRVLTSLGLATGSLEEARSSSAKIRPHSQSPLRPYYVLEAHAPFSVEVHTFEKSEETGAYHVRITSESGAKVYENEDLNLSDAEHSNPDERQKTKSSFFLELDLELPMGYFQLQVTRSGQSWKSLILSSPSKAFLPSSTEKGKQRIGVFAPIYALHDADTRGMSGFREAKRLSGILAGEGYDFLGVLPMYAGFTEHPPEISPYTPVSKLAWNEAFVDLKKLPEIFGHAAWNSYEKELNTLEKLGDDRERYLAFLDAREEFLNKVSSDGVLGQEPDLQTFLRENPDVDAYARFRGAQAKLGRNWRAWPEKACKGSLQDEDIDEGVRLRTAYLQWYADQQVSSLSRSVDSNVARIYVDMPLGVHRDSYDQWQNQDLFLDDLSVGAPPDAFLDAGQNWGFAPLNPMALEETGFLYIRQTLGFAMKHSDYLRLDHVMSLHRLFVIPEGYSAKDGVYLRFAHEALYAIVKIESHRHECIIIGEDLGVVPQEVRDSMETHALQRMFVFIWELNFEKPLLMNPAPRNALICLGTHDMFPFRAFLEGRDIDFRRSVSWLSAEEAHAEHHERALLRRKLLQSANLDGTLEEDYQQLFLHVMNLLCNQGTRMVLANLEDFWGEVRPQNIPGTLDEYPNWSKRLSPNLEDIRRYLRAMPWND